MTNQKLIQYVHQLTENYNQTHNGQFSINYHKGHYRLIHSDVPTFEYPIHYFSDYSITEFKLTTTDEQNYIQTIFNTVTQLIAIYKTLAKDFHSQNLYIYKDHIERYDDAHQTILKPLSNNTVTTEQTYRPKLTEITFQKDGVDILLTSDNPYHQIEAYYTAKVNVTLEKLNDTIITLKEKTQNIL